MASGALPPAFPAVRIDGELYWDGGILSNTPVEAVFDDNPRRNSLVFAVHIWNPHGPEPETDLGGDEPPEGRPIFEPRRQPHQPPEADPPPAPHHRRTGGKLPESVRNEPEVRELAAYGCLTRMHVVRLLAPPLDMEDHTKDIDFSAGGIRRRWEAGYADTAACWTRPRGAPFDPIEGFILHDASMGRMIKEG